MIGNKLYVLSAAHYSPQRSRKVFTVNEVAITQGNNRQRNIERALHMIDQEISTLIQDHAPCRILIKPNMVRTNMPLAATHMDALLAILKYLQRYNQHIEHIAIGEGPAGSPASQGYQTYGYYDLQETYAIDFIDLNTEPHHTISLDAIDGGTNEIRIAQTPLNFDLSISVTLPKTHETVIYSGVVKNFLMGIVIWDSMDDKIKMHGFSNRSEWTHYYPAAIKQLHKNLVTLLQTYTPDIGIIDGFVAMEGNGPVAGSAKPLGIAVAGTDPVAVDAVTANILGINPLDIGYLYYANQEGLGQADISQIRTIGAPIEAVFNPWKLHQNIELEWNWR
jgi:uncharacterized protein (DUF362 family)